MKKAHVVILVVAAVLLAMLVWKMAAGSNTVSTSGTLPDVPVPIDQSAPPPWSGN